MTSFRSHQPGFLIILGGLPGVGKTTIAREISKIIKATHIRIDTIEASIRGSFSVDVDVHDAGYKVAYNIARNNLMLGLIVVADSVNSIEITRESWRNVASDAQSKFIEIKFICSDIQVHENPIMTRDCDILDLCLPTWSEVKSREYQPWVTGTLTIDTFQKSVKDFSEEIIQHLLKRGLRIVGEEEFSQ